MESREATGPGPARPTPSDPIKRLSPKGRMKLALMRFFIVLTVIFTVRYLGWRLWHTGDAASRVFFYAFLLAEGLGFLENLLFYFIAWNPTHYARPEPIQGRTVDVFIPTYNEPPELLRETVLCAVNVRYPHNTYVLDDGRREEVRELAAKFNCGYITREDNKHAKAGNLNHALSQTTGEFIVTLDADHVASPELIDSVIGFFADPRVAAVQATQDFYNLDSFQHLMDRRNRSGWQQQELFFSVIQPGKDRYNAAFYCGSPGVLRRSALLEIGGFPTGTITEDMHTSLRFQKRKWRVIYYNRTLARGLAPQTFTGFATQWLRWGVGAMQVLRQEKPFRSRALSLAQKIAYFGSFYFYWMSYVRLFFVVTPILSLYFNVFPLVADPTAYALNFLPYCALNLASSVLVQRGWRNFFLSEKFNLLKMHVLIKTIAGLLGGKQVFFVTPKARAAAARASEVLLPLALLGGLATSVLVGFLRLQRVELYGFFFWALVVNMFWGTVFFFMMASVVRRSLSRKERRATYRFPARTDARLRVAYTREDGAVVNRQNPALDLNRSGAGVVLNEAIPVGTLVHVELTLPNKKILALGRVVRSLPRGTRDRVQVENGIRFEQISPADQDDISKYLFGEIAPQEGQKLRLTWESQAEEETR